VSLSTTTRSLFIQNTSSAPITHDIIALPHINPIHQAQFVTTAPAAATQDANTTHVLHADQERAADWYMPAHLLLKAGSQERAGCHSDTKHNKGDLSTCNPAACHARAKQRQSTITASRAHPQGVDCLELRSVCNGLDAHRASNATNLPSANAMPT